MIIYSNIKRLDKIPFQDYLALPGYSHSFLKLERSGIAENLFLTENIRIGKLVDSILTDSGDVNMADPLYSSARDIAWSVEKAFGKLIKHFEAQVSYTATAEYNGFKMPVKGRLDWLLRDMAVIDLKVTNSKNIHGVINHMGYVNQVWHYACLAEVSKGYLMMHSIPLRKTEIIKVDISNAHENSFWQEKILSFGTVELNI